MKIRSGRPRKKGFGTPTSPASSNTSTKTGKRLKTTRPAPVVDGGHPDFWARMWEFATSRLPAGMTRSWTTARRCPGPNGSRGRLNFAENLLRYRDDRPASFSRRDQKYARMTYRELYRTVRAWPSPCGSWESNRGPGGGLHAQHDGDAIAMLASASVGAAWSSCATDIGSQAALDRLGQIEPKVLFTVNVIITKGRLSARLPMPPRWPRGSHSQEGVVASYPDEKADLGRIPNSVSWEDFLSRESEPALEFEQLPSTAGLHHVFLGTTGKPKCMVQGPEGS